MEDPTTLAMLLADAAMDAWQDVADRPDRHENVGMGADGTPTTRADQVLEAAVLETAGGLGLSVLSEEAGFVDHGSKLVAVVDPLDGTRNAGRGIPFYCTSVAIGRQGLGSVEAAVVLDLVSADTYVATRGQGAFHNGRKVTPRPFDPDEVIVALITDDRDSETVRTLQARRHHLRDLGAAALELCLVGTGALDAFRLDTPWLRVVDIAAGTLFVREAGGLVLDPATRQDLDCPLTIDARVAVLAAHSRSALEAVV